MMAQNDTESLPDFDRWLDRLDDATALKTMAEDHAASHAAIMAALPEIAAASGAALARLQATQTGLSGTGRLIYAGAGTSARVGVQDGVELTPTFGWPKSRLGFLVAGGDTALMQSVEGAEDDAAAGGKAVAENAIGGDDVVMGLSASGATPFTCGVIAAAREAGALTIGIANNNDAKITALAEYGITLATGGEVVAGSTRMKAATAQKICLNMISTLIMARMGRVRDGMMVAMRASNEKLKARKKRIDAALKGK